MPPPRRKSLPPKAGEIFVDREGPLRVFENAAFTIPSDRSIVRVFYGIGGQGKTALCRKLFELTGAEEDPSYGFLRSSLLDLHGRPKTDPDLLLIWIRNGFAKAGVAFPTFDLAFALVWEATRGEQLMPKLENAWLARSTEALVDVAPDAVQAVREAVEKSVETIPGLGVLVTKGSRWVIDKARGVYLKQTRESLKELYRGGELKKPYELSELLPWMLAQDLNHHVANQPQECFVLFVDEYEGVFEEGGAGARWKENPFDRHLRTRVQECNGLLAVFFSREKLPWDDDPDWRKDLEGAQHLLGGLSDADAREWLGQVPVEDATIVGAIVEGAREEPKDDAPIYPLLLDLQVEHWRQLTAANIAITPAQFHLSAESFEARCRELVQRIIRDYGDELQITLERLSVANRFDRAAFEHVVREFGTGLPFDSFDRLGDLSFVTTSEDGFLVIHRPIAEAIRTTLDEARHRSSVEALFDHYESRARAASSRDVTDDTVSALDEAAYLRREIGPDGYVNWLGTIAAPITIAARYVETERLWRHALQVVSNSYGQDHPDTATSYNNVAMSLNAQGRYDAAEPHFREALEIRERVLGEDHPDTGESYNNVASNLNSQGRYEQAEPLFRKALEIRERVLGEDHPDTVESYNNLAFNLNARGRFDEAKSLLRKAVDISERVLGKDHPRTDFVRLNLQALLKSRSGPND